MPTYAKMRSDALILNPVAAAVVPENNSIFSNSDNGNEVTVKDDVGNPDNVGAGGSNPFLKNQQSGYAGVIPINTPVSKLTNGKIVPADSDAANGQKPIGVTTQAFGAIDVVGSVHLLGANVVGAITSLGFAPGDEIYLGELGGYTNDPNSFTGENDSIIKIGIADCAAGTASATAQDLILTPEVITRP